MMMEICVALSGGPQFQWGLLEQMEKYICGITRHKKPHLPVRLFVFVNRHYRPAGAEITCPSP